MHGPSQYEIDLDFDFDIAAPYQQLRFAGAGRRDPDAESFENFVGFG